MSISLFFVKNLFQQIVCFLNITTIKKYLPNGKLPVLTAGAAVVGAVAPNKPVVCVAGAPNPVGLKFAVCVPNKPVEGVVAGAVAPNGIPPLG